MTRMWMVNPKLLCRVHLLGEHNELHKIVGSLRKKRSISGYIKNDCIEPKSIRKRHNELVNELKKRDYNHKSPLPEFNIDYLPKKEKNHKINKKKSKKDLLERCVLCSLNYNNSEVL